MARPGSQQVDLVQVAGQDRVPHVLEDLADVLRVRGARVVAEEAPGARALLAAVRAVHAAGVHAAVHVQDEPLGRLRVLLRAWGFGGRGGQSGHEAPRAGTPRGGSADPRSGQLRASGTPGSTRPSPEGDATFCPSSRSHDSGPANGSIRLEASHDPGWTNEPRLWDSGQIRVGERPSPLSWLGLELGDGSLNLQRQAGANGETEAKNGEVWPQGRGTWAAVLKAQCELRAQSLALLLAGRVTLFVSPCNLCEPVYPFIK